jgi:hypothetical protein
MKYFSLIILVFFISCANKEDVLLPKASTTIVKNLEDLSPIYLFFRTKGKDTLVAVNRKNSIITTNWILNIDKRLPLRLVIPEVMKLQKRKREEKDHRNESAENYYSYADTIGKNLAFIPFTKVYYKMEKPKSGIIVFFAKNNTILVNNIIVKRESLHEFIENSASDLDVINICFDENLDFGSYIQNKIFIESLKVDVKSSQEFIF